MENHSSNAHPDQEIQSRIHPHQYIHTTTPRSNHHTPEKTNPQTREIPSTFNQTNNIYDTNQPTPYPPPPPPLLLPQTPLHSLPQNPHDLPRIRRPKHRRPRYNNIRTSLRSDPNRTQPQSPINLNIQLRIPSPQRRHLRHTPLLELLSPKPWLHSHHQHHLPPSASSVPTIYTRGGREGRGGGIYIWSLLAVEKRV